VPHVVRVRALHRPPEGHQGSLHGKAGLVHDATENRTAGLEMDIAQLERPFLQRQDPLQ
jgi:hypothetical protein